MRLKSSFWHISTTLHHFGSFFNIIIELQTVFHVYWQFIHKFTDWVEKCGKLYPYSGHGLFQTVHSCGKLFGVDIVVSTYSERLGYNDKGVY